METEFEREREKRAGAAAKHIGANATQRSLFTASEQYRERGERAIFRSLARTQCNVSCCISRKLGRMSIKVE